MKFYQEIKTLDNQNGNCIRTDESKIMEIKYNQKYEYILKDNKALMIFSLSYIQIYDMKYLQMDSFT